MITSKANIIEQLQKEILSLQGFKTKTKNNAADTGLGVINNAFPNGIFPLGAVHEFIAASPEDKAASLGFIAALLSSSLKNNNAAIWISGSGNIFPPALQSFGIAPDKIIFLKLNKENEILWAMEEALKYEGLSAVVCEVKELSFLASRRLQLAVEKSQITGFVLQYNPRAINTTACICRWKITNLPTALAGDMPGVGFPRWQVNLLKVRNGRPGNWQLEWVAGRFRHINAIPAIVVMPQKKTG